jgi:hypothetical protein
MNDRLNLLAMIALVCGGALMLPWASKAAAQTVPAYEGGGFAWDYPAAVPNHGGFALTVEGIAGSTAIAKDARQIKIVDTVLAGKPFGAYTVRLIATAISPAKDSAPAVRAIDYKARPQLAPPTNTRTILEWQP